MSIQAAPRQVKYTKARGVSLRVMDDYVPFVGAERPQYATERWYATSGTRDRDWTGKGVGCYHGTDHNGKAILCEGKRCKMLPPEPRRSTNGRKPRSGTGASRTSGARATRGACDAFIRSCGYQGLITPQMRALARDAIEHAAQVEAYTSAD